MKKDNFKNQISKDFNKSRFSLFTLSDFQRLFTEYQLSFWLCERIVNGAVRWKGDKAIQPFVETHVTEWLKAQYALQRVPSPSQERLWQLLISDELINPYGLKWAVFAAQYLENRDRNQPSQKDKAQRMHRGKYHLNQGGRFGAK